MHIVLFLNFRMLGFLLAVLLCQYLTLTKTIFASVLLLKTVWVTFLLIS